MPSSRGSSPPRDRTHISPIAGRFFTVQATREALVQGRCSKCSLTLLDLYFFLTSNFERTSDSLELLQMKTLLLLLLSRFSRVQLCATL